MKNVTDRTSNPFGMRPPCQYDCDESGRRAVHGYGDANADLHIVGDHPGIHGGQETGIPFTGSTAGERLQSVLNEVGLLRDVYKDSEALRASEKPAVANLFMSYLHTCCLPEGRTPTEDEYADLERFFDAELRAIAAHVLLPVGERATRRVLRTYAAREAMLDEDGGMATLHAEQLPGRGFLVVPIREPSEWEDGDRDALVESLTELLDSDYYQIADLSRFLTGDDTYTVR